MNMITQQNNLGDPVAALDAYAEFQRTGVRPDALIMWAHATSLYQTGDVPAAMSVVEQSRAFSGAPSPETRKYGDGMWHYKVAELVGNPFSLNLGDRAGAVEHYQKAIRYVQEWLALNPKDADARRLSYARIGMGAVLLESDPGKALAYFREALPAAGSRSPGCRVFIGSALRRLHRLPEAIAAGKEAIQAGPSVFAYSELGDTLLAAGDRRAAEQAYRDGLALAESEVKLKPRNMPSRCDLADVYERLGAFHAAAGDRQQAHDWYVKSLEVWNSWTQYGVSSVYDQRRRAAAEREAKKYGGL